MQLFELLAKAGAWFARLIRAKMKITVVLDSKKSSETAASGTTVGDLMKKRKLNPQLFVALKNGSPAHEKDALVDGDLVAFVKLIYGG